MELYRMFFLGICLRQGVGLGDLSSSLSALFLYALMTFRVSTDSVYVRNQNNSLHSYIKLKTENL